MYSTVQYIVLYSSSSACLELWKRFIIETSGSMKTTDQTVGFWLPKLLYFQQQECVATALTNSGGHQSPASKWGHQTPASEGGHQIPASKGGHQPLLQKVVIKSLLQKVGIKPLLQKVGIKPLLQKVGIKYLLQHAGEHQTSIFLSWPRKDYTLSLFFCGVCLKLWFFTGIFWLYRFQI